MIKVILSILTGHLTKYSKTEISIGNGIFFKILFAI